MDNRILKVTVKEDITPQVSVDIAAWVDFSKRYKVLMESLIKLLQDDKDPYIVNRNVDVGKQIDFIQNSVIKACKYIGAKDLSKQLL